MADEELDAALSVEANGDAGAGAVTSGGVAAGAPGGDEGSAGAGHSTASVAGLGDTHEDGHDEGDDDTSPQWRARPKHVLIFSDTGRPVYSRYGAADKLAGFVASLQAMASFAESGGPPGNALWSARCGDRTLVLVRRGPLFLAAVSRTDETSGELAAQLEALHGLVLAVLTDAFERAFARRSTFDLRGLLGDCGALLDSYVDTAETCPGRMCGAWRPLSLRPAARAAVGRAIAGGVADAALDAGVAFALCLTLGRRVAPGTTRSDGTDGRSEEGSARLTTQIDSCRVAALAHPSGKDPPHARDLAALTHFVASSADSLRAGDEALVPLCLPRANKSSFAYVHVSFCSEEHLGMGEVEGGSGAGVDVCVVLVATGAAARQPEALEALSAASKASRAALEQSGAAKEVAAAAASEQDTSLGLREGPAGDVDIDELVAPAAGPVLSWVLHAGARGQVACSRATARPRGAVGARGAIAAYKRVRALALPGRDAISGDPGAIPRSTKAAMDRGHSSDVDSTATVGAGALAQFFFASPQSEGGPAAALLTGPAGDVYCAMDSVCTRRRAIAACQELAAKLRQHDATLLCTPMTWPGVA